jgi:integrase
MASINYSLSAKVDAETKLQEVMIRFSGGRGLVYRGKSSIYVNKSWLSTARGKFLKDLPTIPAATQAAKQLELISVFIKSEFQQADPSLLEKDWLTTTIDKFHHPEKYVAAEDKPQTLLSAVEGFVADADTRTRRNGDKVAAATKQIRVALLRHVREYLASKGRKDFELEQLDRQFFDSFTEYLQASKLAKNSIVLFTKILKAALNQLPVAQRAKVAMLDAHSQCTLTGEENDTIYLDETELARLATTDCPTETATLVRDQFILMAWCGVRYSDLPKLCRKNMVAREFGKFFQLTTQKTSTAVSIPILPAAEAILEKYNYNFPKLFARSIFIYEIRKIAKRAGLTEEIRSGRTIGGKRTETIKEKWQLVSPHTARRSFATNMYKRGLPSIMIMKITGHKTEKNFLRYIRVSAEENCEMMLATFMAQEAAKKGGVK